MSCMPNLRSFFETFAAANAASNPEQLAALYASTILVAGPQGPRVILREDLLGAIPQRQRVLDSVGHHTTTLVTCDETPLADRYALVRTTWRWDFHAKDVSITVPSTFLVDRGGDLPQIVVYLPEGDVMAALRERGLLGAQS